MSANGNRSEAAVKLVVLWGLAGCCGAAAADDNELPDLEFLEYLGSWEGSDEEWLLFSEEGQAAATQEEMKRNDRMSDDAPTGEESTELENES